MKSIGLHVWPLERTLREIGSKPEHELVGDDATAHVPIEHEREAAEHLALAQRGLGGEELAHAFRQLLVVGHGSAFPGRGRTDLGRESEAREEGWLL